MLKEVREKFPNKENLTILEIDIQNIPFADGTFDFVIANHMLYHVPDLAKGLSEVKRVLKTGGTFYASTMSDNGMRAYLHDALYHFNPSIDAFKSGKYPFTLENGETILKSVFNYTKKYLHYDSLEITQTQDLINWILSTISATAFSKENLEGLYDFFENIRIEKGTIEIPKLAGMFVCKK
jgi:SAM-dependent methyltransferase